MAETTFPITVNIAKKDRSHLKVCIRGVRFLFNTTTGEPITKQRIAGTYGLTWHADGSQDAIYSFTVQVADRSAEEHAVTCSKKQGPVYIGDGGPADLVVP